jgi:RNA polymerase sigma-70 factor (ECF subfamily)
MVTRSDRDPCAAEPAASEPESEDHFRLLIEGCQHGDPDAFRELVERTEPQIRRLMGRLLGRRLDLDDLVQEVYLRAWRGLSRFRGDCRLTSWLCRIAVNTARTWRRDRRLSLPLSGRQEQALAAPAEIRDDLALALYEQALSTLSPELRMVFVLHEAEGRSYREVAAILDCPIGTVMSRLHRARARILRYLRESGQELIP